MSITSKRAAEVLSMAVTFNGCGRSNSDEMKEAVCAGIAALREKAERENPRPLTVDELLQMDGVPVWITDRNESGYEFSEDAADYFEGREVKGYGKTWTAYRHKPKEVQK